jgi:ketosteroid isomerase-like protein
MPMPTDTTATNLAKVREWEETFNHDIDRMVHELYAPDANLGGAVMGHEKFLKFERRVLAAAPKREMRVKQTHVAGDTVVVEAILVDPDRGADWKIPFCAVLTFADGKIVRDQTYADFSQWPGMG